MVEQNTGDREQSKSRVKVRRGQDADVKMKVLKIWVIKHTIAVA